MSESPYDEDYALPPEAPDANLAFTRMIARLWVWLCPGAGYAGIGWPILALISFSSLFVYCIAFTVYIYTMEPVAKWVWLVSWVVGFGMWLAELALAWLPSSRTPAPKFLTRLPILPIIVVWTASFLWGGIFILNIRSLILNGDAMNPTAYDRERFIYLNRAEEDELKRGTVIIFRTPRDSGWQPNMMTVARIAAVPGDRIAFGGGRLIINGQPGPAIGETIPILTNAVALPTAPGTTVVPANCYFVCSDNAAVGFDSRTLGWAERDRIVSTRIWYLRRQQFFDRVG